MLKGVGQMNEGKKLGRTVERGMLSAKLVSKNFTAA